MLIDMNNKKIVMNEALLTNVDRLITLSRNHVSAYTTATNTLEQLINHYYRFDKMDSMESLEKRIAEKKESKAPQINGKTKDKSHKKQLFFTADDLDKEGLNDESNELDKQWLALRQEIQSKVLTMDDTKEVEQPTKKKTTVSKKKQETQKPRNRKETAIEIIERLKAKYPKNQSLRQIDIEHTVRGVKVNPIYTTQFKPRADKYGSLLRKRGIIYKSSRHYIKEMGKALFIIRAEREFTPAELQQLKS